MKKSKANLRVFSDPSLLNFLGWSPCVFWTSPPCYQYGHYCFCVATQFNNTWEGGLLISPGLNRIPALNPKETSENSQFGGCLPLFGEGSIFSERDVASFGACIYPNPVSSGIGGGDVSPPPKKGLWFLPLPNASLHDLQWPFWGLRVGSDEKETGHKVVFFFNSRLV